jgi:hypothetical protein
VRIGGIGANMSILLSLKLLATSSRLFKIDIHGNDFSTAIKII